MHVTIASRRLELENGDITLQCVDAIVNAANAQLAGGGGVDGAIHRRGGPAILAETARRYPAGCPTGSAVISGAGQLAAQYVNEMLGDEYQYLVAGILNANPVNMTAKVPDTFKRQTNLFRPDWAYIAEHRAAWTERWAREISG